jgi:hypothetical protein
MHTFIHVCMCACVRVCMHRLLQEQQERFVQQVIKYIHVCIHSYMCVYVFVHACVRIHCCSR